MEPTVDSPQDAQPRFTVVPTDVGGRQHAVWLHVCEPSKAEAALVLISRVLEWIELQQHYIVYTNKARTYRLSSVLATVTARTSDAPASRSARAQVSSVAPVVTTSSTSSTTRP